jgi:hypothetical protein
VLSLAAALSELDSLHQQVDERAQGLARRHAQQLSVVEIEALKLRERHAAVLRHQRPHPAGRCALLGPDGGCRVYPDRPYVCRTQGLPLRWLEEAADATLVELRDVCSKNFADVSITALTDTELWLIGPYEARLAALQRQAFGGLLRRVKLRDLFGR